MDPLPLLRFRPVLKQYLWGGRRLGELLGKPLGPGDDYAESWEVVDHADGQSVVESGPLAGKTLGELARTHGAQLYGRHAPQPRFPLLLKFLDANRTLSVQVHPNDAQGSKLDPPDLGKTEAWVVLDALPGAKIYAGLRQGVGPAELRAAIKEGACDACLYVIEPRLGDCVFIPAGTVHALGEGLVIAEIQQASNTTFRLFDWNRVDQHGVARPLHIEQSLAVTDYERGPVAPQIPQPLPGGGERLVSCDKFVLDRHPIDGAWRLAEGDHRFHILALVGGAVEVESGAQNFSLPRGGTLLAPASRERVELRGSGMVLDMFLP